RELYDQAATAYEKKQYKEAVALLGRVLDDAPDFPGAHFLVARSLHKMGNVAGAIEHHRDAVRLAPTGTAFAGLAYALSAEEPRNPEEVVSAYRNALERGFQTPAVYNNLAFINDRLGRLGPAEEALTRALALDRSFRAAHLTRTWVEIHKA